MNIQLLFPFFIGLVILAATPGPGIFASMAKAVAEGFKSALFFNAWFHVFPNPACRRDLPFLSRFQNIQKHRVSKMD